MTASGSTNAVEKSRRRNLLYAAHYFLGSRRGLLVLAGAALLAGLALNWSWLVAAGFAPILISVLPCVAMCALGLCMNRGTGKSCATSTRNRNMPAVNNDTAPAARAVELDVPVAQATVDRYGSSCKPETQPLLDKEPTNA